MIGAIAGDIIGSAHEFSGTKTTVFPLFPLRARFTDDTVLSIATAEKLLTGGDYAALYRKWGNKYPGAGYGGRFKEWLQGPGSGPYNSFGNGSAMRVSPVGFACRTLKETLDEAARSAAVTHNHPEGIKGAQAVAAAIFLARKGKTKRDIAGYVSGFGYRLGVPVAETRKTYSFDETCQGSVPQALDCFLESKNYEDAIRKAVSIGGDADTLACITGGIAQAFYGSVPARIAIRARGMLPVEMQEVLQAFEKKYMRLTQSVQWRQALVRPAQKPPRIILLDDDERYLKLFEGVISSRLPVEVFATTDCRQAIREARIRPPLVLITDIVHEDLDGISLLKLFKHQKHTKDVKVWIISGNIPRNFKPQTLMKLGADFVHTKPCPLEILEKEIRKVLGAR